MRNLGTEEDPYNLYYLSLGKVNSKEPVACSCYNEYFRDIMNNKAIDDFVICYLLFAKLPISMTVVTTLFKFIHDVILNLN